MILDLETNDAHCKIPLMWTLDEIVYDFPTSKMEKRDQSWADF